MSKSEQATGETASRLIDLRIRDLGGWRGETLARMRALILEADPEMTNEWKWMGTPAWSRHGIVCTGEAYTKVVKLTFARGARIPDPSRLFNSSLEGNTRRAIDIHEGEKVDAGAFKALVKAAVAQNGPPAKKRQTLRCNSEQWWRRISHLKFTRSGEKCGQVWEAFTPEFNKMRQNQPTAYPDYGSITIRGAGEQSQEGLARYSQAPDRCVHRGVGLGQV